MREFVSRVLFALLQILPMCLFHFKSRVMLQPTYFTTETDSKIIMSVKGVIKFHWFTFPTDVYDVAFFPFFPFLLPCCQSITL